MSDSAKNSVGYIDPILLHLEYSYMPPFFHLIYVEKRDGKNKKTALFGNPPSLCRIYCIL